jgi:hypothetical protein
MAAITFGELKEKIIRVLGDIVVPGTSGGEPTRGETFEAAILKDGVHAALDALTIRRWKPSSFDVDGGSVSEDLPDDLIDVEAVLDITENIFLERTSMQATHGLANGFYLYPAGTITFTTALGDSGATVYYSAYWLKPEDDEETLESPEIATTALTMFAASYCLLNSASAAASIRQFGTKVDSGKPTDNPLEQSSTYFMKRFEIELQRIPPSQKGMSI